MSTLTEQRKPKRKYRTKPQPVCPVHGVPMLTYCTRAEIRYCKCPEDGCREAVQQLRD